MKEYEIKIILDKVEISKDFRVICWTEIYKGNKRGAIKRAKELQKEWKAEFYEINKIQKRGFNNEI